MPKTLSLYVALSLLLSSIAFSHQVVEADAQIVDINTKLDTASNLINKGNLEDAINTIKDIPLTDYNKRLFELRAGLLAGNREYKDAVILLNRILEDASLSDSEKSTAYRLKEYSVEKLDTPADSSPHVCNFCHARIASKSAYCPVCLQFQHKIGEIKSKNTKVLINYSESGRIQYVSSDYINRHIGKNIFGIGLAVGLGAVGGIYGGGAPMSLPMIVKDPDTIKKSFQFRYNQEVPQTIYFQADAVKGAVTTSMIALDGIGGSTSGKVARRDASRDPKEFEDLYVYSNNPVKDPVALKIAFGINISRMFYQSTDLEPFRWDEPHTFSVEYGKDGKITSAVDIYKYERNDEGKYLLAKPNPAYKDIVHISFDESDEVWKFDYNSDGLLATLTRLKNGIPVYRRIISYGSFGIDQEVEVSGINNSGEFKLKIDQLKGAKDAALEKAKQKNESEEKLQKIRNDFDSKILSAENDQKAALLGNNLKQTNLTKYSWSKPNGGEPAKLQKASSGDLSVTFK